MLEFCFDRLKYMLYKCQALHDGNKCARLSLIR